MNAYEQAIEGIGVGSDGAHVVFRDGQMIWRAPIEHVDLAREEMERQPAYESDEVPGHVYAYADLCRRLHIAAEVFDGVDRWSYAMRDDE